MHIRFTGALSRVLVTHLSRQDTGLVAATRLTVIRAYSWTNVIIPLPTLTAVQGGCVGLAGAAAVLLVAAVGAVVVTGTVLAAVGVRGRQVVGPLFAGVAAHALHVGLAPALPAVLVTSIREDSSLVHKLRECAPQGEENCVSVDAYVQVQCCFTSTVTIMTIWAEEPRTATSTFTQLLGSGMSMTKLSNLLLVSSVL